MISFFFCCLVCPLLRMLNTIQRSLVHHLSSYFRKLPTPSIVLIGDRDFSTSAPLLRKKQVVSIVYHIESFVCTHSRRSGRFLMAGVSSSSFLFVGFESWGNLGFGHYRRHIFVHSRHSSDFW